MECKKSAKNITGYKWTLRNLKRLSTEGFWTWDKGYQLDYDGDSYLDLDKCFDFEKELWLELGKCMWRKHRSVFKDHTKYIRNDIVKPLCVGILRYAESVQEMHNLAKKLPQTSMKGESFEAANWKVHKKNDLYMIFGLLLRTDSPYPCRISWMIIKRTTIH